MSGLSRRRLLATAGAGAALKALMRAIPDQTYADLAAYYSSLR